MARPYGAYRALRGARPLEDAMRIAFEEIVYWLSDECGFSEAEVYLFLGQVLQVRCTRFCCTRRMDRGRGRSWRWIVAVGEMAVRQDGVFKGRHFTSEAILWALRWYLAFPISYRDLASMLSDRGVMVDHTTVFRCRPMPPN